MKKFLKYGFLTLLVIVPLATIAGYCLALSSEPFAVTKSAIMQSSEVRMAIGEVKDVDLAFFGYFVRYQGPTGAASFRTTVKGMQNSIEVYVDLERNAGQWNIKKLRVNH